MTTIRLVEPEAPVAPVIETLLAVRDLLAERYWPTSLDGYGHVTNSTDRAVLFSLMLALERCAPDEAERHAAEWAIRAVWGKLPRRGEFDSLRHWEGEVGEGGVLALLDAAIGLTASAAQP